MIITFVLPFGGKIPIGGFKIIYEYGNRLSGLGHEINIIHPCNLKQPEGLIGKAFNGALYLIKSVSKSYSPKRWFNIAPKVKLLWVPYIDDKYVPDGDAVIATECRTASPVLNLSSSKGEKYYFIQSLETWFMPESEVLPTWKYPLKKIVISKWLKQLADSIGEEAEYIPNGVDADAFGLDIDIEKRTPYNLMMLYHESAVKGTKYGTEAMKNVRSKFPDVNIVMFGTQNAEKKLPGWASYERLPGQTRLRELYNSSSIFISPSLMEGFPLPPAEAMLCGCAVVATDIEGHKEYCTDGQTALLCPPENSEAMTESILTLLRNPELRIRLAKNGNSFIKHYTWKNSVEKFNKFLTKSYH